MVLEDRTFSRNPKRIMRMIRRGLYSCSTWKTGQPAVQVPQAKHFLRFSPPGRALISNLKLGSSFLPMAIVSMLIPPRLVQDGPGQEPRLLHDLGHHLLPLDGHQM